MIKIENILWPTDFSEDSTHGLTYARTLAEQFGTRLYLLHVIDNPTSGIYGSVEGDYLAMEANARDKAREFLRKHASEHLSDFPNHEMMIKEGDILLKILETVAEKRIGTIVMSTHGGGGLRHLLLGSVTEKVIRSVSCPVYVARHPSRVTVK